MVLGDEKRNREMKTTRQTTILALSVLLFCVLGKDSAGKDTGRKDGKPNVLFIAIDDLNDWNGMLKGNPQARTPHMNRLASKGMVFTNPGLPGVHCHGG